MLFDKFKFGKNILKNRFALAPMTRITATEEGVPTGKMRDYYEGFAKGNFGLIITEGTFIDNKYSQTYKFQPGITSESHVEGWKSIVSSVHTHGAKIILQIQHSGALSQGNRFVDQTMGPSSIQPKGEQLDFYYGNGAFQIPLTASINDINQIIQSFTEAALNAEKAGFDGVEIHGANGYLLDQFLTLYTNTRTDEYGGDLKNRLRIYEEVIKAIKENVSKDFIVGIRLSQGKVNDYNYKWKDLEEAKEIFRTVENAGVDYIHVTEFNILADAFSDSSGSLASIAKDTVNIPIIANGGISNIDPAKKIIENNDADLVSIGKLALSNKDFPIKLEKGIKLVDFDPEKILRPMADLKDFEYVQYFV